MSLYQRLHGKEERPAYQPQELGDKVDDLRSVIQSKLVDDLELGASARGRDVEPDQLRERIRELTREELGVSAGEDVLDQLLAEIAGLGALQPLLDDDRITEIMVNGRDDVYIERGGQLQRTGISFRSDADIYQIIERIVAPLGRRIDESSPMVDARLPDGSRVNAIIPPLALRGPCLTIRKFPRYSLGVEDLLRLGTLDERMAQVLQAAVRGRLNILISGGTASGKTTLLNVLSSFIPEHERIVTIEDAAELRLQQGHVVALETRPPNVEGRGEVSIRQLVRNALRMRPDRIVIGEVRTGEALDMLQAMNTGHDGSLSTVHANAPRDALSRLETMVLMAGLDLPLRAIREQIASALHIVVQQARLRDGKRCVTHITEVQGMEGDVIVLQDIFRLESTSSSADGRLNHRFLATGLRPRFVEDLSHLGITLGAEVFQP